MNVLVVVEDDPGMRILIHEMLGEDPAITICGELADLDAALEAATSSCPELMILDHFIEGDVMGMEAAAKLKEACPTTKILLFTSHDLTVEVSREPAIDRILLKKHLDELLPTVRSMLGLDT